MSSFQPRPPVREPLSPWPFAGLVVFLVSLYLVAASGPVTPWWGQLLLLGLWAAALARGLAWWSTRPWAVLASAIGSIVVWFAAINLGAALLGWG